MDRLQGQLDDADMPLPRVDVPQRRHAAQGRGPRGRRLPRHVQHRRQPQYEHGGAVRRLSRILFGSLNDDVLTLDEHVGDTPEVIDILVNQSPEGLEVLGRSSTHTYDGTWKVQAENGTDGYH